jgi:hypothetical protein
MCIIVPLNYFYLPNPVYSSTKFKQQSILGFAPKKTNVKQPIPVTKEGIKEHFLAIITTCDLVSNIGLDIISTLY